MNMLEELRKRVFEANCELQRRGLVVYTWGNASAIEREKGLIVIKPSGVPYEELSPEKMVIVDLEGKLVEGNLRPSVDTMIHVYLYRHFEKIGGVVHTHSLWACAWAQAMKPIPCLGGTHADYFYGEIPCTRALRPEEVDELEKNTGRVIVETFEGKDYLATPGVIVAFHGPFTWGDSVEKAVFNSVVLEEVAKMAAATLTVNPHAPGLPAHLLEKRYQRKHGKNAYYGQPKDA
jgi:L-ribulose-5-phosphate 4-epimerase